MNTFVIEALGIITLIIAKILPNVSKRVSGPGYINNDVNKVAGFSIECREGLKINKFFC